MWFVSRVPCSELQALRGSDIKISRKHDNKKTEAWRTNVQWNETRKTRYQKEIKKPGFEEIMIYK